MYKFAKLFDTAHTQVLFAIVEDEEAGTIIKVTTHHPFEMNAKVEVHDLKAAQTILATIDQGAAALHALNMNARAAELSAQLSLPLKSP